MGSFGEQLRQIRQQKGAALHEFAKELGVSPVYLSNLETGKTQTIQLEVLSRLQNELHMVIEEEDGVDPWAAARVERIGAMLMELYRADKQAAEYLMGMLEQGIEMFVMKSLAQK
ncbi:helix-turn-helix domain-containing protein [Paenibacillus rigui]|uniref:Transcriptional regulator n=1 Tax=Paenibacillus rigui TaxID=554312 RepID=A0A229UT18_9BACL|nr:helix-turn-helix transcriptional regulator [Paenibacillus rigui]OXM86578.1 transcriptional regulator [Paenibacillus rigui]